MAIIIYAIIVLILAWILHQAWEQIKKFIKNNKGLVVGAIILFVLLMILL